MCVFEISSTLCYCFAVERGFLNKPSIMPLITYVIRPISYVDFRENSVFILYMSRPNKAKKTFKFILYVDFRSEKNVIIILFIFLYLLFFSLLQM